MMTNKEISEWTKELTQFGLTVLQARVYASLLTYSSASVKEMSTQLLLHRAEVYRVLKELKNMGLVSQSISRPAAYAAFQPDMALETLISRKRDEIKELSALKKQFVSWFKEIDHEVASKKIENRKPKFILIVGRPQIYHKIKNMLKYSKREADFLITANGLRRHVRLGRIPEHKRLRNRGVKSRIITEICHENLLEAEKLSEVVELRHSKDVSSRFTITDNVETIIGTTFKDDLSLESEEDTGLWTDDREMVLALKKYFETIWKTSVDAKFRIKSLKTSGSQLESGSPDIN